MSNQATSDVWWKNAIVYCLDVETFVDSGGDGIGDFQGLTQRVDYLAGLGVTCIWLMPFYPTPNRDDGYDITDYYNVDPRLGTLGDFVEFVRAADERGMRVVCDLVVNHTSKQHPWFQSARSGPDSPYRSWYVWTDEPRDVPQKVIFPDVEDSNWTYDEQAGQYYLHRFYREQPDLNITNPQVRDEIHRIIGFWLQLGVSGFRVDAVPYLIERIDESGVEREGGHGYIRRMREYLQRRRGDAVMLGEVNLAPDQTRKYFGDGDELQLITSFYGNGKLYLALARADRGPLQELLDTLPRPPETGQWANFVRNHDEANFSQLPQDEMEELLDTFAPDEDMRLFGRGVRRRLPPMLDGNQARIRMTYSLMFTLPGTPTLYYGEEVGMGDDLSVPGREAVRTVMQWNDERAAGFSRSSSNEIVRPLIDDGPFSYLDVNVASQRSDPDSLLNWVERMIRTRKECPEFGWGEPSVVDVGDDAVFVLRCDWLGNTVLAVHNLAAEPRRVTLPASWWEDIATIADLFPDRQYHRIEAAHPEVELSGYGYRWLRLEHSDRSISVL